MQLLVSHKNKITAAAISPCGSLLATGSLDRTVRVWRLNDHAPPIILRGHTNKVSGVAFSPDSRTLYSVSYDGDVRIWSLDSGKQDVLVHYPCGLYFDVAISPDGRWIAIAHGAGADERHPPADHHQDSEVRVWDLETRQHFTDLVRFTAYVRFSPNGRWLLAAGSNEAALYEVPGMSEAQSWPIDGPVNGACFSPDGGSFAIAGRRTLYAFGGKSFSKISDFRVQQKRSMSQIAWLPDDTLLTVSLDGLVRRWHISSGKEHSTFSFDIEECRALAVAPDGLTAVVGGRQGRLIRWDLD